MGILYIAHRINTIDELKSIPDDIGIELDLRDDSNSTDKKLYIQHDPFVPGEDFEHYLQEYKNKYMIINVKSERIEHRIIELLVKYGIEDYFFLDSSFPMINELISSGNHRVAIRFSEYEGVDTIRALAGKANWIWIDSFRELRLDYELFIEMKNMEYHLCLVSPELQNRDEDIERYADYLNEKQIMLDAICTKVYNIERWKRLYPVF